MIKAILIVLLVSGVALCPEEGISAAEKTAVPESLINELRPPVEFSEEEARELFMEAMPKIQEPAAAAPTQGEQQATRPELPALAIQGLIWGSSVPCVIINNKVLKEGESIGEIKVIKIGKEGIKVLYKGWDYKLPSPAAGLFTKSPEGGKQ